MGRDMFQLLVSHQLDVLSLGQYFLLEMYRRWVVSELEQALQSILNADCFPPYVQHTNLLVNAEAGVPE